MLRRRAKERRRGKEREVDTRKQAKRRINNVLTVEELCGTSQPMGVAVVGDSFGMKMRGKRKEEKIICVEEVKKKRNNDA